MCHTFRITGTGLKEFDIQMIRKSQDLFEICLIINEKNNKNAISMYGFNIILSYQKKKVYLC